MCINQRSEHSGEKDQSLQCFLNQEVNLFNYFLGTSFGQCIAISRKALSSCHLQIISLSGLKSVLQDNDLKSVLLSLISQNNKVILEYSGLVV